MHLTEKTKLLFLDKLFIYLVHTDIIISVCIFGLILWETNKTFIPAWYNIYEAEIKILNYDGKRECKDTQTFLGSDRVQSFVKLKTKTF